MVLGRCCRAAHAARQPDSDQASAPPVDEWLAALRLTPGQVAALLRLRCVYLQVRTQQRPHAGVLLAALRLKRTSASVMLT